MKKSFKRLALATAFSLCLIGKIDAATLAVGSGSTPAGTSKSIGVELRDSDLGEYDKVEFQLSVTGTDLVEIDNVKIVGLDFGVTSGPNGETIYTFSGNQQTANNKLIATTGTISFKTAPELSTNFKITPTNVKFYKGGTPFAVGEAGIKVIEGTVKYEKPKSTEAFLTSLKVSQGTLSPEFSKDVMEYTVQVKDTINSIRFTADSSLGSTKTGTGSKTLEMGENEHEIVVTAEDGVTKNTYKIKIIRGEIAEPSAYLKKLDINNIGVELSPEFDSKNNKYTVKVGKDITELNFKYETEDPLAEVTIEGNEKFIEGENVVKIKVLSSNKEEEQIYEITVIKEEEKEEDDSSTPTKDDEEEKEKKKNPWLLVLIGAIVVLIVGGVSFLLFKKKKPNDKNKNKSSKGKDATITVKEGSDDEEESITENLKKELYDDDRTQNFDEEALEQLKMRYGVKEEEQLDKTKEFNFKDLD